ncbi:hypothetical protein MAPG_02475 [Magnaporthiopsis poae ATCC 64411]|uniref:Uncharacterized protein n=1 Tax=Magnaporthiopsis poae (strain ATCC 64411 / 73-15) TaxID=644358 RepID=A0A0C4DRG7_MAGP6|nr:hypothetical protein MAPG_02475 [Magnaporthiopsis poae ATCC 64411]
MKHDESGGEQDLKVSAYGGITMDGIRSRARSVIRGYPRFNACSVLCFSVLSANSHRSGFDIDRSAPESERLARITAKRHKRRLYDPLWGSFSAVLVSLVPRNLSGRYR